MKILLVAQAMVKAGKLPAADLLMARHPRPVRKI
jgi:hypothetical protein